MTDQDKNIINLTSATRLHNEFLGEVLRPEVAARLDTHDARMILDSVFETDGIPKDPIDAEAYAMRLQGLRTPEEIAELEAEQELLASGNGQEENNTTFTQDIDDIDPRRGE